MKMIIMGLILSINALAVETKDCPIQIQYKLSNLEFFDVDVNGENDLEEIGEAQQNLMATESDPGIEGSLKLKKIKSGQCHYEGKSIEGFFIEARLEGSTKLNAVNPAFIVIYLDYKSVVYFPIKVVSKSGLTVKEYFTSASIFFRGEICDWENCIENHIPMAAANNAFVK